MKLNPSGWARCIPARTGPSVCSENQLISVCGSGTLRRCAWPVLTDNFLTLVASLSETLLCSGMSCVLGRGVFGYVNQIDFSSGWRFDQVLIDFLL